MDKGLLKGLKVKDGVFCNSVDKYYKVEVNDICFGSYLSQHRRCILEIDTLEYELLEEWLKVNIIPYLLNSNQHSTISTYGLKHIAERHLGFYVSNETVKFIMCEHNIKPTRNTYKDNAYPINLGYAVSRWQLSTLR